MEKPISVTAAIIRKDGKILITQRLSTASNEPDKWEFPGGKVEPHESPEECLGREVKEELDIEIVLRGQYTSHQHVYKNGVHVVLLFYLADFFRGELKHLQCQDSKWIGYEELEKYDFAEADIPLVKELVFAKP